MRGSPSRRNGGSRVGIVLALGLAVALLGALSTPAGAARTEAGESVAPASSVESGGVLAAGSATLAGTRVNGTGSSYVGLAMQQWTAEAQVQGLEVNYTPTGSPDGLSRYRGGQVDFAGTEAEFSSLQVGGTVSRGYQYVPDVAGAVAVMYNATDLAGRKIDYLHLSRSTVAKIFMGEITHWDDPQIAADNAPARLAMPAEPINVVYRSGQSGTTALFYDFVKETEPSVFASWAARNSLPTSVRIIQLDSSPGFAPRTQALSGSDQIAQFVASDAGRWSIAYDEFGYAKVYGAPAAWIENESGKWVQPYAENISAALDSAKLRDDLSQDLRDVYTSRDPLAYPISAYSYIVTQCEDASDRPSCAGNYSNSGVSETLSEWLLYIACDGQARMAEIGYSPLPTNLSQEMANSVARMNGTTAQTLTKGNCGNPRFSGSLGPGSQSPPDPYLALSPNATTTIPSSATTVPTGPTGGPGNGAPTGPSGPAAPGGTDIGGTGTGTSSADGTRSGDGTEGANSSEGTSVDSTGTDGAESIGEGSGDEVATGLLGQPVAASGGGSGQWREPTPMAYAGGLSDPTMWPVLFLAAALVLPALIATLIVRRQSRS